MASSQGQQISDSTYNPTGTDEAEFRQWQENLGRDISDAQGIGEITPDDYYDAGFTPVTQQQS